MTTKYTKANDHYVSDKERVAMRRLIAQENLLISQVAYEMRMSRTHVSCMLSGTQKMARVHLLAMRYILLTKRMERVRAERAGGLTPEITI